MTDSLPLADRIVLPRWTPGHAVTSDGLRLVTEGALPTIRARDPLEGFGPLDARGLTRWQDAAVLALTETTTTNAVAMLLAECGAPDGTCVLAGRQTLGRGRSGRVWDSPLGGGLYYSVVLSQFGAQVAQWLPLVGALSWVRVLEGYGLKPQLKWPNDLLLDGQKLGGVLAEGTSGALVLGIGINLRSSPNRDPRLDPHVARLEEYLDPLPDMTHLFLHAYAHLEALVQHIEEASRGAFETQPYVDELRARCVTLGADVRYLHQGAEMRAHAVDLDARGGLIVRREDGSTETIYAGDVHLVRP